MSDKEKKGASGASLAVVEKSRSSRHKPYRPTALEDSAAVVHHTRSKPAAHSAVAEELKNVEEIMSSDYDEKERIESLDSGNEAKAVSSNRKHKLLHRSSKQKSSAEAIALAAIDVVARKGGFPSQPIPSSQIDLSPASVKDTHSHESLADTVTDLDPTTTGIYISRHGGKTKIGVYSQRIDANDHETIGDKLEMDMPEGSPKLGSGLVQKTSFGPYIQRTPYREPSGIAISIAQRSKKPAVRLSRAPSGIVFSYPKKPQAPRVRIESFGDGCNSHIIQETEENETRSIHLSDTIDEPKSFDSSVSDTSTEDSSSQDSEFEHSEVAESEHLEVAVNKMKWKTFFRHICPKWK